MRYRMLAALLLMLAAAPRARGDGCYIPRLDPASARASYAADISEPEQKAAIAYFDGHERLILQVSYKGKASEFVWLVPMPSKPTVVKCDYPVFDTLHEATLPRLKYSFDVDKRMHDLMHTRGGSVRRAPSVEVMERKALGFYDVAVLRARNASDLISWLKTNGYKVKPALEPVLSGYIDRGWVFTTAKIRTGTSVGEGRLDALQFDFRSDRPIYPLKISSLNPGRTKLLLYVLADHRVDASLLKTVLVGSRENMRSTFSIAECLSAFFWDGGRKYTLGSPPFVTKLTGDLAAAQMNDDIVLRRARTDDIVEPTVPAPFFENLWSVLAFALTAILIPPWSFITGAVLLGIGMTRRGQRSRMVWLVLAIFALASPVSFLALMLFWPVVLIAGGTLIAWLILRALDRRYTANPPS